MREAARWPERPWARRAESARPTDETAAGLTAGLLARIEAAAREAPPLALLPAIDAVAREATGHGLLTAMRFDAAAMTVQRIWSSMPEAYPVGGAKPKRDTAWGRQVLLEQRVFVGEGEAAIRAHFADHAVILGLGLRSIVNVPVVAGGACLGTLNILWSAERVAPEQVALARLLGLLAVVAWG
jgi:GAF domain-containing protein